MNDDLRRAVEHDLPQLAQALGRDALAGVTGRWPNQFRGEIIDWARTPHYAGPVTVNGVTGYEYQPYHRAGRVHDKARITFFGLSVRAIEDIAVGELEVLNPGAGDSSMEVDSTSNDSPSKITHETEIEQEVEKEETTTSTTTTSIEIRNSIQTHGGASLEVFTAGGQTETEITERMERSLGHEWRSSTRVRDAVRRSYEVWPYMDWTLSCERSIRHIRQDVSMTGRLDCQVRIDSQDGTSFDFDSLQDVIDCLRGLRPSPYGAKWGDAFRSHPLADSVIAAWPVPALTLNCPIEGRRTRYVKTHSVQTPIVGREDLAKAWMAQEGFTIDNLNDIDDLDDGLPDDLDDDLPDDLDDDLPDDLDDDPVGTA